MVTRNWNGGVWIWNKFLLHKITVINHPLLTILTSNRSYLSYSNLWLVEVLPAESAMVTINVGEQLGHLQHWLKWKKPQPFFSIPCWVLPTAAKMSLWPPLSLAGYIPFSQNAYQINHKCCLAFQMRTWCRWWTAQDCLFGASLSRRK